MSPSQTRQPQQQQQQQQTVQLGVKGIRLKHFERALTKLLPHIEPRYMALPASPITATATTDEEEWPNWNGLPPAARVYGSLEGQLSNRQRATRKEQQIQSVLRCIFALLPATITAADNDSDNDTKRHEQNYTIADFGGGSGHLSIPLALLLPNCTIITIDLKQKSLDFLHEKADRCFGGASSTCRSTSAEKDIKSPSIHPPPQPSPRLKPTAITNLWTFSGDIESFTMPFDLSVALHVCGEATDVVLRKSAQQKAHLVVAPCCVGKLNRQKKDPYIYRATAKNTPTILYPQSQLFRQCLQCNSNTDVDSGESFAAERTTTNNMAAANDWDALAKAADYSHELDMNNRRNAARRTAKGVLEMDRKLFLEQEFSYQAALTRMEPLTASPKHDILLAYFCDGGVDSPAVPTSITTMMSSDRHADQVVDWTKDHLLSPGVSSSSEEQGVGSDAGVKVLDGSNPRKRNKTETSIKTDSVDWTWEEEQTIRNQLLSRFPLSGDPSSVESTNDLQSLSKINNEDDGRQKDAGVYVFPPGMGGRKRKLIHFVAEQLGLAHWSVGKKHAEKAVGVRRRHIAN